jgi:hypothetical protein
MKEIKKIFKGLLNKLIGLIIWHPHHSPRCMHDSARCCDMEGCIAYSKEEIQLVISDVKGNQLKTHCKRLAIAGAHIEALRIFNQDSIRRIFNLWIRENEQFKGGKH